MEVEAVVGKAAQASTRTRAPTKTEKCERTQPGFTSGIIFVKFKSTVLRKQGKSQMY